jgi:predicted Fe-Mo cluster-binding NifX family protein
MMKKIAFVTKDKKHIIGAFGSSKYFNVFTLKDDQIVGSEVREVFKDDAGKELNSAIQKQDPNPGGFGKFSLSVFDKSKEKHMKIAKSISDCDFVVARAMCANAWDSVEQFEMRPIRTNISKFDEAIRQIQNETIVNEPIK